MADTQRSVAQILALLADNTAREISPQDLRDAMATWQHYHGQIHVSAGGDIVIDNTDDFFEATGPTWSLNASDLFDQSEGNGRLTYVGAAPVTVHITASVSMLSGSNNQILYWRLGVNGTTDEASEIHHKLSTMGDVVSSAILLIVESVSPGDYISLWCRNTTGANNITVEAGSIKAITFPT